MIPNKMRMALTGAMALATAVILVSPPLASAAPVTPSVAEVTQSPAVKQLSPADAEKYWTPERMRDAKPVMQDVKESPAVPKDASPVLTQCHLA